jgi:molybdate-binding protein
MPGKADAVTAVAMGVTTVTVAEAHTADVVATVIAVGTADAGPTMAGAAATVGVRDS